MEDDPEGKYQAALEYLVCNLPDDKLFQLVQLLQEAKNNGYGVVKIVVVDRRVKGFRLEKMYE